MARKTSLDQVPPYLKAITVLEAVGNIAAETSAAVDNMRAEPRRVGIWSAAAVAVLIATAGVVAWEYWPKPPPDHLQPVAQNLALLEPKYTTYRSPELKITFSYPDNILSLNDRQRKQNVLLLQDGTGQVRLMITRKPYEDIHDVAMARDRESAALEKLGSAVTYERTLGISYVLSGVSNNTVFYFRRWFETDGIVSIEFTYPIEQKPLYNILINDMIKNFVAD